MSKAALSPPRTDTIPPQEVEVNCEECHRLERMLLESMVYADRAETSLRCFLITHQHPSGVSDSDEYQALRTEQQRTTDQRHGAFINLVNHARNHG